ncbi:MAG: FAD-linked oxidase C-terminal domain-containing protein [Trueperaceae bacterium]|nr:FAD-linked oxidase C-terminal domain-containing protein [Trueperaceae bacterium]
MTTSERAKVDALSHDLVEIALDMGGTSTGEHGVGVRKLRYMAREHGEGLELMRTIKRALDPRTIMNPGKKLPDVD